MQMTKPQTCDFMMNFEFSKQLKALKFNSKYWWQGNSHESISILRDYPYCFDDVWIQLNSKLINSSSDGSGYPVPAVPLRNGFTKTS